MEELKDKILLAADELFSSRGARDVTIDDVCRHIGISKKTFYQYYPQKEDLVGAVLAFHLSCRKGEFHKGFSGRNPVESLHVLVSMLTKKKAFTQENRFLCDIKKYYPETYLKGTVNKGKVFKSAFRSFIDSGIASGDFRADLDLDADVILFMLLHKGMIDYLSGEAVPESKRLSFKRITLAFADILTHSLLTPKGWDYYKSLD